MEYNKTKKILDKISGIISIVTAAILLILTLVLVATAIQCLQSAEWHYVRYFGSYAHSIGRYTSDYYDYIYYNTLATTCIGWCIYCAIIGILTSLIELGYFLFGLINTIMGKSKELPFIGGIKII